MVSVNPSGAPRGRAGHYRQEELEATQETVDQGDVELVEVEAMMIQMKTVLGDELLEDLPAVGAAEATEVTETTVTTPTAAGAGDAARGDVPGAVATTRTTRRAASSSR